MREIQRLQMEQAKKEREREAARQQKENAIMAQKQQEQKSQGWSGLFGNAKVPGMKSCRISKRYGFELMSLLLVL